MLFIGTHRVPIGSIWGPIESFLLGFEAIEHIALGQTHHLLTDCFQNHGHSPR